jgi:hypothetical protein
VIVAVFAPTATGTLTGTLNLRTQSGSARDVLLSGTGIEPALLEVQPSSIDFDGVDVGVTRHVPLTVTNRGTTPTGRVGATIATVEPGFSVTRGTCTTELGSGESCALDVMFIPAVPGPHTGAVRVASTPGGTLEVPVRGTGNAPATLSVVARESADFGEIAVGSSAVLPFSLGNTGTGSAGTLLGITLGGSFSVLPSAGAECQPGVTQLDSGASCDFRVMFQPDAAESFAISLRVSTSLGGGAQLVLTGAGASGAPSLVGSASTLQFPMPDPAQSYGSVTWTVRNAGTGPTQTLVFTNSNTEEFPAINNTCFGSLAAGGECSVRFGFDPNAAGQRTGVMTLTAGTLGTSVTLIGIGAP